MTCYTVNQTTADATNNTSFAFAPEPETLRIIRTVLFSLIAVLSLVGNYVVCRAVWKQPGTKPFAYYLVSNLAFAEILSTISLVFTIHAHEPPWSWKLGYAMCKILDPLQIASALVITTTLASLAVYRCLLLVKPLVAKPTRRQKRCVIIATWVGSVGLSVPASIFRVVNSYGDNCNIHACEEVFPEGYVHYQDAYSVVLFVVNFALPLVIMAISYALVSKKIKEHIFVIERLREAQSKALSVVQPSTCVEDMNQMCDGNQEKIELVNIAIDNNSEMAERNQLKKANTLCGDMDNTESRQNLSRKQNESTRNNNSSFELENDLLRMIFAIVLIFVVCYIPYQVQFLLHEFRVEVFLNWPHYYTFSRIVFTLTCFPSALHPVFYGMMSKFYRKAFIRIISCRAAK
ncbi:neuropeptide Y receptor type 2-like [Oculina patagonica]